MEVLIVDDDAGIGEMMADALRCEGYSVSWAANGREAMQQLRLFGDPPRLILLDLSMPVMNGWQFRDEQVRDPQLARIPVVVLSGEDLAPQGVAEVLRKPVDMVRLLGTVRSYCGHSG